MITTHFKWKRYFGSSFISFTFSEKSAFPRDIHSRTEDNGYYEISSVYTCVPDLATRQYTILGDDIRDAKETTVPLDKTPSGHSTFSGGSSQRMGYESSDSNNGTALMRRIPQVHQTFPCHCEGRRCRSHDLHAITSGWSLGLFAHARVI